jgi:NRPS condensation-like uncharacterized protein
MTVINKDNRISERISRRVPSSSIEHFHFAVSKLIEPQIHLIISLDKHIDETLLARSVHLTLEAQPLLGYRFTVRTWKSFWEQRDDTGQFPTFTLINATNVDQEIENFMQISPDPCRNKQVMVRVIRAESDTICIKLNHMLTDATGMTEYAYLLASIYRQLSDNSSCAPSLKTFHSYTMKDAFKHFNLFNKIGSFGERVFPPSTWAFPWTGVNTEKRAFAVRRLSPELFARLKAYCTGLGSTINDVVVAAYYRALFTLTTPQPGKPFTITTIIDFRRYLESHYNGNCLNLYSAVFPRVTFQPDETFSNTVIKVRDSMNSIKSSTPGLSTALFREMVFRFGPTIGQHIVDRYLTDYFRRGKINPIVSNVGVIDIGRLQFGEANTTCAFPLGPITRAPLFMLCFGSYQDTLWFTASFIDGESRKEQVDSFFGLMENELASL